MKFRVTSKLNMIDNELFKVTRAKEIELSYEQGDPLDRWFIYISIDVRGIDSDAIASAIMGLVDGTPGLELDDIIYSYKKTELDISLVYSEEVD